MRIPPSSSPSRSSSDSSSRGLILVVVIGLLAILAVLAAFFLKQSRAHKNVSHQQVLSAQVKLMAQSGIEEAVSKLRQLYFETDTFPSAEEFRFFGFNDIASPVNFHEFGVLTTVSLDHATWPSYAVTDPATGLPESLTIIEEGKSHTLGWSGTFDGTFVDRGDFYSLRVVDAQSKLNLNDQNPEMGRLINRLCEILYYDEDLNRNGVLDAGEDNFSPIANTTPPHPDHVVNNHRWDCIIDFWPVPGPANHSSERPWTEDRDEDGLLDPNEDFNADTVLQTGHGVNPGRGPDLAWDTGAAEYESRIGTFLTAYLHHEIRQGDFFSSKNFNTWGQVEQALIWAHDDGISNAGARSRWEAGDPAFMDDAGLRERVLIQLKPYITLHSWQDLLPMPIGLAVTVDTGDGDTEIYGRLARDSDIDASFPNTPGGLYGGSSRQALDTWSDSTGAPLRVLGVGSEIYALREMLPRHIKMVRRSPVNINTCPLHLLVALFSDLQGVYVAEEPISNKPEILDRDEILWQTYFNDSRYEGNHWYRWMTPLYFDDNSQSSAGGRNNGQHVGIGRIHRSFPVSLDVAAKLAYSIECLRRGEEDLNGNGRLDQDLDFAWNNAYDQATPPEIYDDLDINRSTPAHPQLGTHDTIDGFEDSFRYIGGKLGSGYDRSLYPGNLNLVLDAPFSNWQSFNDFIDKILPNERHPEVVNGQSFPHGDINRNGVLDDGGIGNENREPREYTLSYPDFDNGFGPLCSGDLSYVQKDVIKSNFNPNLHLNEFNPDRLLSRWVDKLDLERYSTEFCFEPKGVFEIECLARIVDQERQVKARHRIEQSVEVFRIYKEDTQKEFLSHLSAPGWNSSNHSVHQIFSPNTLHADDTGDIDPTCVTVGFGDSTHFLNGQALMSYPDVQRYDRVVDDPHATERGSYYEGYLGLAATAVRMGSGASGQSAFSDPSEDLLYFKDPLAYAAGSEPEGLRPLAASTFFDEGVVLRDRNGLIDMPASGSKLGPVDRGNLPWGSQALIPNDPNVDLSDPSNYPSRHMADGVFSEATGVIEFPWEDSNGNPLFDVRFGGGVMFWVKPNFHPDFAEKVRTFYSMGWINPNAPNIPTPINAYDVPGLDPAGPAFSPTDFYVADTSALYESWLKAFVYDQDFSQRDNNLSKWITIPHGTTPPPLLSSQFGGPWGRASYDYTNEYSGRQQWGLAPFGCYFFPNHYGSFAGWGGRYPHRSTDRGNLGANGLLGSDPGITRTWDPDVAAHDSRSSSGRLNYYDYNPVASPRGAMGADDKTSSLSPGRIQDYSNEFDYTTGTWSVYPRDGHHMSPTEVRLYGYPTFRRAQEVRGYAMLSPLVTESRCDYGVFSGDLYFKGVTVIGGDTFYGWQRDIAFGRVEKTGRSLGWGCGFTPATFNLTAVTRDSFAGGIFSANLHPLRFNRQVKLDNTLSVRRYFHKLKDAEHTPARFMNMMEQGKWMHLALYGRLDTGSFVDANGTIVDIHPANITHQQGVLTFDGKQKYFQETGEITSTSDYAYYHDHPGEAPWMSDGLDFIPLGAWVDDNGVYVPQEMAPGTNNTGATIATPRPNQPQSSFIDMSTYLEPLTLFFDPNDLNLPLHQSVGDRAIHAEPDRYPTYDGATDTYYPNVGDTFPHRPGGYLSQTMGLLFHFHRGFGGGNHIPNHRPIETKSIHINAEYTDRYWPNVNYSAEVDYFFQMYINGLMVNQGSHRWDQYDLDKINLPGFTKALYNTQFSRGYAEGNLIDGVVDYPTGNFFDDPNNRVRFGEDVGIASCNYPADATFRNIVFTGTEVGTPFPPTRKGVNRKAVWNTTDRGQWTFDYRPAFEHYFRGAFYPGEGYFISRELNHQALQIPETQSARVRWGRIRASLVTSTPSAWGDHNLFKGVRHSFRGEAHNGSTRDFWGDFPDDSFINNAPNEEGSKKTRLQREMQGHLPISLGYGRLNGQNLYARIGGHARPIHRARVSSDLVLNLGEFNPNIRLTERVSYDSGGRLIVKDGSQNLENNAPLHYRLMLDLDEKNPMRDTRWKSHRYRIHNDRELPVLSSPFIDDVTLTYSIGTRVLSHQEEFD